jgi:hypothetical protein
MTQKNVTRPALIALAVLAALALLGPVWPGARLSVSTGTVEIGRGEPPVWKQAEAGDTLAAGDRVRTGEDGRAEVIVAGSTLRVYPNSLLRLPDEATPREVGLEKGSSLFDVIHNGEPFEVRTPEVVVSVKGTRFGVEVEGDEAAVSVFRGLVGVHGDGAGASETLVHAGFSAFGHDQFELSWHGAEDPWNGWNQGGELPKPPHHDRRDAALRDAREVALLSARDLAHDGKAKEHGEGHGKGKEHGREHDGMAPPEPPAAHDDGDLLFPGKKARDPLSKVRDDKKGPGDLEDALNESILENTIENATNGLLTINFVDGSGGSGSDRVELAANLDTWVFEENQLDDILEGEESLPENLVAVLESQGVNDQALVNQLLTLFRN